MRISIWGYENEEITEKWRFELFLCRGCGERKKEKAARKKTDCAKGSGDIAPPDEMDIFARNIEAYDGTDRGQIDL